jgi:hypothetical protein
MAVSIDLWHPVDAPPAVPYRFGLFSVVAPQPAIVLPNGEIDEHWRVGITWQSQNCGNAVWNTDPCWNDAFSSHLVPDDYCDVKRYDPFTVYAYNNDAIPGRTLEEHRQDAVDRLLIREQAAVENELRDQFLSDPSVVFDTGNFTLEYSLARAEQWLASNYGGVGVIYLTRDLATLLWNNLRIEGGKLVTTVGTPVVAWGAQSPNTNPPSGSLFASGPLVMYRGDVDTREMAIDKSINRVSYIAQREYVIGWDCVAYRALVNLDQYVIPE